ncbi:MAG: hypothetical protein QXR76_03440 [Candidatus Bathyarchaeia archaeon]
MKKAFLYGLLAVLIVVFSAFLLFFTDAFLVFFNAVLGNNVYAVTVSYTVDSSPDFTFTVSQLRIPVESILSRYKIKELSEAETNGNITLNVLIYVLNRQKLFQGTFTFTDAKSRQIIIYLPQLKPEYEIVTIEVIGNYNNAPITAGAQVSING